MSRLNGKRLRYDDEGSAIVEYALVATFLLLLTLGVIQTALVLHARNVLVADAAEGARAAAVRGGVVSDGENACAELVRQSIGGAVKTLVEPCRGRFVVGEDESPDGESPDGESPDMVRMEADAMVSLAFIPGGRVHLHAVGRAVREPQ